MFFPTNSLISEHPLFLSFAFAGCPAIIPYYFSFAHLLHLLQFSPSLQGPSTRLVVQIHSLQSLLGKQGLHQPWEVHSPFNIPHSTHFNTVKPALQPVCPSLGLGKAAQGCLP